MSVGTIFGCLNEVKLDFNFFSFSACIMYDMGLSWVTLNTDTYVFSNHNYHLFRFEVYSKMSESGPDESDYSYDDDDDDESYNDDDSSVDHDFTDNLSNSR